MNIDRAGKDIYDFFLGGCRFGSEEVTKEVARSFENFPLVTVRSVGGFDENYTEILKQNGAEPIQRTGYSPHHRDAPRDSGTFSGLSSFETLMGFNEDNDMGMLAEGVEKKAVNSADSDVYKEEEKEKEKKRSVHLAYKTIQELKGSPLPDRPSVVEGLIKELAKYDDKKKAEIIKNLEDIFKDSNAGFGIELKAFLKRSITITKHESYQKLYSIIGYVL